MREKEIEIHRGRRVGKEAEIRAKTRSGTEQEHEKGRAAIGYE